MLRIAIACLLAAVCHIAPAAVDPVQAAADIDRLVEADLAAHGQQPAPAADEATILRRSYLVALGRIPSLAEQEAYWGRPAGERQGGLARELVASLGWEHQHFAWLADLLRVQSRLMNRYPGETYIAWLKDAVHADLPWDEMVRQLITASGPLLKQGSGAAGYYVRDAGMPLDNMSNTVQVFLGTRLACAQCHNHPFDTWTRIDYLRLAAYSNAASAGPDKEVLKRSRQLTKAEAGLSQQERNALRRLVENSTIGVQAGTSDAIAVPKDYQYPDARPGSQVRAKTIFGAEAVAAKGEDPRLCYAAWMTAPGNPRFAEVIANRMWKRVFGVGVIEPVDNLSAQTVAANPALMQHLGRLMVELGFDLRRFQEVLLSTRLFHRPVVSWDPAASEPFRFAGPALRRLRAEEVWDSLLTLIVPDLDQRRLGDPQRFYAWYEQMHAKTPEELLALAKEGAQAGEQRRQAQERLKELEAQSPRDAAAIKQQREALRELNERLKTLGQDYQPANAKADGDPRWKDFRRELVRASELPQPAPPGHFLRDFGQSDRQLIENANDAPSVPQALSLLNGLVDQELLRPRSVLMQAIAAGKDADRKLAIAVAGILCRRADAAEMDLLRAAAKGPRGMGDVVWALVNSHEFLFLE